LTSLVVHKVVAWRGRQSELWLYMFRVLVFGSNKR